MSRLWKITMLCDVGHEQVIRYEAASREMAEVFAGLMDGSFSVDPGWTDERRREHIASMRDDGLPCSGMCMYAVGGDPPCGNPFTASVEEDTDA